MRSTASITSRRRVAFDPQPGSSARRSDTPCGPVPRRRLSGRCRRDKVEALAGGEDLDGVEILAAEHLDAGDVPAARRNDTPAPARLIDAEVDRPVFDRALTRISSCRSARCRRRCRRCSLSPRPENEGRRRRTAERRMVDHSGARVRAARETPAATVAAPSKSRRKSGCR